MVDVAEELWNSIGKLALAWREQELIRTLNKLVPIPLHPGTSLQTFLQAADAGAPEISRFPMRMGRALQIFEMIPPVGIEDRPRSEELENLKNLAWQAEWAHLAATAWVRSNFPGYPTLRVPQLARNTDLTTEEFSHRYPWLQDHFAQGFQFKSSPDHLSDFLGGSAAALYKPYQEAVGSWRAMPQWREFRDLPGGLTH